MRPRWFCEHRQRATRSFFAAAVNVINSAIFARDGAAVAMVRREEPLS